MQRNLLFRAHGPILFYSLTEKDRTRSRPVDLDMAIRAVCRLRIQVVLRAGGLFRAHTVRHAVTGQTELCYTARNQQTRVGGTVRSVTGDAPLGLNRSMLVNKRTLFVCVTLDARCIRARRQSSLFEFKAPVWIVAIAALHGAFQHFVMERQVELVLGFAVTTETKLWLAFLE